METSYSIDLNCDMGESFGAYQLGDDAALMPFITSANIACGFHAGDPAVMKRTVKLAMKNNVSIGAHPGLPDLQGFGRRTMAISPEEAYDMVVYQVGALSAFVKSEGGVLNHVKPHGALYNSSAINKLLAEAIAEAIYKIDPTLILFGLSGSESVLAAKKTGLKVANEVFADRTYQENGTLTARNIPGALITDHTTAVTQVMNLIKHGKVKSLQGSEVKIAADTICIHGDGEHAATFATLIFEALKREGINLSAPQYSSGNLPHK